MLAAEVRRYLALTAEDGYSVAGQFSVDELTARLVRYESTVGDLSLMLACVSHWGQASNISAFRKCFARSADRLDMLGGNAVWLALRRYPIVLEFYFSGISAVNAGRFDWLNTLFETKMEVEAGRKQAYSLISFMSETLLEFARSDIFKMLPGHERHKTPISEYLYKILQPGLDDAFFLGKSYEGDFDRFELFLSIAACDAAIQMQESAWGPLGRFFWKGARFGHSPYKEMILEADRLQASWPPIQAGMFGGSYNRFKVAANSIGEMVAKSPY